MKLILIMDSGSNYTVEIEDENYRVEEFIKNLYNDIGILRNTIMRLGDSNNYINPSHISSIEVCK